MIFARSERSAGGKDLKFSFPVVLQNVASALPALLNAAVLFAPQCSPHLQSAFAAKFETPAWHRVFPVTLSNFAVASNGDFVQLLVQALRQRLPLGLFCSHPCLYVPLSLTILPQLLQLLLVFRRRPVKFLIPPLLITHTHRGDMSKVMLMLRALFFSQLTGSNCFFRR